MSSTSLGPVENPTVEVEEKRPMADDLTWVRVTNRLPAFGRKVMLTRDKGGGNLVVESGSRKCTDQRGEVWDSADRGQELTDVTAWAQMPNPAAP